MRRSSSLFAVFLVAACGLPESRASGPPRQDPGALSAVVRVVCEKDGASVLDPRVRPQRDGAHVVFINRAGADEFYMRAADDPDENHGGLLRGDRQKDWAPHPPGVMWVGCFERGEHPPYYAVDDRYASFEIVDDHDLWVSWKLECAASTSIEDQRLPRAETQEDVFEWFRDRFDLPPGEFQKPGYPTTAYKGNPWVLHVDGRTIANIHPWKEEGLWTITVGAACT